MASSVTKEKKVKKEKHSSKDGVHKSKKTKKSPSEEAAEAIIAATADADVSELMPDASDADTSAPARAGALTVPIPMLKAAMVPFANPLVEDKAGKKVLKGVKKSAKAKTLKRGVKEVVKALRKSAVPAPNAAIKVPAHVCVLAADISPMDVISHLPVLCEDHGVPYVYVTSRAELGAASQTKRPTSVVLVTREVAPRAADKGADLEGWDEAYGDLVKVVVKAGRDVRV